MTINDIQDEIIGEFEMLGEWMDKYEYIIQLGKELPPMQESLKTDDRLIKGCQSRVWLHADFSEGILKFTADSDALITKGLVALMIRVLSGHTPKSIAEADIYFIERIGLQNHLSPSRANGLLSMLKQMKLYAVAIEAKNSL
ncbi:MAG TPA: SufE family protein [Ferruginibacter sp.]|nr:SufE family protein [Ferruginibacter sp.]HRQ20174.1 SufE family protein [Ferruginibacter sp.]